MESCVYCGEYATFGSKTRVPSFFVQMEVLAIEVIEEVRVANVQFVWCDSNNRTCCMWSIQVLCPEYVQSLVALNRAETE
jgi:hypothetical protein